MPSSCHQIVKTAATADGPRYGQRASLSNQWQQRGTGEARSPLQCPGEVMFLAPGRPGTGRKVAGTARGSFCPGSRPEISRLDPFRGRNCRKWDNEKLRRRTFFEKVDPLRLPTARRPAEKDRKRIISFRTFRENHDFDW